MGFRDLMGEYGETVKYKTSNHENNARALSAVWRHRRRKSFPSERCTPIQMCVAAKSMSLGLWFLTKSCPDVVAKFSPGFVDAAWELLAG